LLRNEEDDMSRKFDNEVIVPAGVAEVWAMTVDVASWPRLTPTITSVEVLDEGDRAFGLGSTARIEQPKQPPRVWTVSRFEAERCFEWRTKVGTVDMVGRHELEPVEGGTLNRLVLELSGFGSGLLGLLAGRQFAAAIATENDGFLAAAAGNAA